MLIWSDNSGELNNWLEEVLSGKKKKITDVYIGNVEG